MRFLKTKKTMYALATVVGVILYCAPANAYRYDNGRWGFRLNGGGTAGFIEPKFKDIVYLGDWNVRAQINYAVAAGQTLGAVYAMDEIALEDEKPLREAFLLYESRDLGRVELGATQSVARKLGVGLPDVGGLRVNDRPIFYNKIRPHGVVIGDTVLTTGTYALRANIVSVPTSPVQYGLSVAGITDDYNYAIDAGIKIRQPGGKLKTALSFGASFMDSPENYVADNYAPALTADWRAQVSAGANVQYNSWILALNGRVIYDKDPIGARSDGFTIGAGASYDLLNYSVSLSYILSDTGVWDHDVDDYLDHTVLASFRYKYSENVDGWTSLGLTTGTPFVAVGARVRF